MLPRGMYELQIDDAPIPHTDESIRLSLHIEAFSLSTEEVGSVLSRGQGEFGYSEIKITRVNTQDLIFHSSSRSRQAIVRCM